MLYLHHGDFSGINDAVLRAWRDAGDAQVSAVDLSERTLGSWQKKAEALHVAGRLMGVRLLKRGYGGLRGAVKRTAWYAEELEGAVTAVHASSPAYDFSLSMQTIVPVRRPHVPNFVFTDHTILCNHHYAGGDVAAARWSEYLPYEQETLRAAAAVFTMSESARQTLINDYGIAQEKAVCVRGGPVSQPSSEDPSRYTQANVVFVGFDWERKGGPALVEAFVRLRQKLPAATLTIVGCSPRVSGDGIEVVGAVPSSEVGAYLSRASVFCMPSSESRSAWCIWRRCERGCQ